MKNIAKTKQLSLTMEDNTFSVCRIKDESELEFVRFESLATLSHLGVSELIKPSNYEVIYMASLHDVTGYEENGLEEIYEIFNIYKPEDFKHYSMSVGDIILIKENNYVTAHFVDAFGFTELPQFVDKIKISTLELATEIDAFLCNFDPFDYNDQVEDKQSNIDIINNDLQSKNTSHIISFLQEIITEDMGTKENQEKANELITKIQEIDTF